MNKFNNSYLEETEGKCKNTRLWKKNPFSNFYRALTAACVHISLKYFYQGSFTSCFIANIDIEGFIAINYS